MSAPAPRLLALGDSAWTVQFGDAIDTAIHARVMALADQVDLARTHDTAWAGVTDVVPTFRSLTVHFTPGLTDAEALAQRLLAWAQTSAGQAIGGRTWRLPACFDAAFAPDLPPLAQGKHTTVADVIDQLLATTFRVYMIGFLPGFPYMGGWPKALATPRLASPRQRVPGHSIAVAGEMCAVYPWDSPGGWNLIGRTPVQLFDLRHREQPAMLAAGDTVRWFEVSASDYQDLFTQCQSGTLARDTFVDRSSLAPTTTTGGA
jgi:KipI family sensor histidine kinase inhibitor